MPKQIPRHLFTSVKTLVLKEIHLETVESISVYLKEYVPDLQLYGQYSTEEIVWVFLQWLIGYESYAKLQSKTGIPHSNFKQLFGAV